MASFLEEPGGLQPEPPQGRQRFSRSPHPYHRQSLELPEPVLRTAPTSAAFAEDVVSSPVDFFDRVGRQSISQTGSHSDSGTEADDERPLLKALTAPPLRPRKGLRTAKSQDDNLYLSPLPTPPLSEEVRSERTSSSSSQPPSIQPVADGLSKKLRSVPSPRKRAALARRILEAALMGAVVFMSFRHSPKAIKQTLLFQVSLAAATYGLHVVGLVVEMRDWSLLFSWSSRMLFCSDPAALLYPLLVPALVAVSLPQQAGLVETNLMIGLCSMPLHTVPFGSAYVQWLLTTLPCAYHDRYFDQERNSILDSELADHTSAYIFPLHICLKTCLEFLTSTSLLPTEIELLSAGLLNLMLFADSPQTFILKGLLWLGGLTLFVACKDVLKWTVSLARVPSWKFRRINRAGSSSRPIWTALDDALGGWLSSAGMKNLENDSSDSDGDVYDTLRQSLQTSHRRARSGTNEKVETSLRPQQNGSLDDANIGRDPYEGQPRSRKRRHTLPTAPSALYDLPQLSRTATKGLAKFRNQPKYYPSLTSAQANILKWIYAGYVYFMAIFTIIGPIRIYVSYRALGGREPIGWALGYLLGDLEWVKYWVQSLQLGGWICLPVEHVAYAINDEHTTAYTYLAFGAANTRLLICAYCVLCIGLGLGLVFRLSAVAEVDTRRKVFHGMMVLMFGVTTFIDPTFISLALALVLAIFLLLDLFRAGQLPPVSRPLTIFLAPYVDGRDHKGPVVISPLFLLIGCAIPLWLSLAATDRTGFGALDGWSVATREVSMTSGIVCVGMGDAAASLIGRRFGRRRWPWGGGKSMEGSAAFAVAVVVGLMATRAYLSFGPWPWSGHGPWLAALGKAAVAAVAASLTETVLTGANDNVLVPVILWLWVKAVGL